MDAAGRAGHGLISNLLPQWMQGLTLRGIYDVSTENWIQLAIAVFTAVPVFGAFGYFIVKYGAVPPRLSKVEKRVGVLEEAIKTITHIEDKIDAIEASDVDKFKRLSRIEEKTDRQTEILFELRGAVKGLDGTK